MSNLTRGFTMRKDGVLPRGQWFNFQNVETETPKIYIYDEIGFWGTEASEFVKELNKVDADSLELHLNSPGGEIFDGLAIYNALKQHKATVTVMVDGLAASAASFIAQAGDEVIMARNAQMMIHDGIAFAYGNEQDMLETAKILSNLSNNIADIYAYAAGQRGFSNTLEDFRALMREEVWYNGAEAVEAGLADTVTDTDDDEAEKAKNKWDLSFYNHAGREKAESPLRVQEKIRLQNRQKGTGMTQQAPENSVDPEVTPAPVPEGTPPPEETGTPTGDPEEAGVTVVPDDNPTGAPTETETATQPSNSSAVQGVMIDGKLVTDYAAINRHMTMLQTSQDEARAVNRRDFVEGLAANNKIGAPQIDSLVALVNGDPENGTPAMSDAQFAAFQASYESAPASTLFDGIGTTQEAQNLHTGARTEMTAEQRADRIEVLEGIVSMHSRRGLPKDKIVNTPSYIELQQLLDNNKS